MKTAYVFPGQGSQFPGMAKDLYENNPTAREMLEKANEILGFRITDIMFEGSAEDLKQTKVTQPAIFLHSVVLAACLPDFKPDMVAGHSHGEFSALAAILALPAATIEQICAETEGVVVAANYNCEGQIVISGEKDAVDAACLKLKEAGARRALPLPVGGAFHSPLMEPARAELAEGIAAAKISKPICPIYQNVSAQPTTDPEVIKANLLTQLTSPVRWTQSVQAMLADGADHFIELGPGKVLQGLIAKTATTDCTIEGRQ